MHRPETGRRNEYPWARSRPPGRSRLRAPAGLCAGEVTLMQPLEHVPASAAQIGYERLAADLTVRDVLALPKVAAYRMCVYMIDT